MGRRSYLKLSSAAVAGIVGVGSASAAEEYDVITVGAGDSYSVYLQDGETLENKLIDITASGASYSIVASGSGWAIRNIGVRGTFSHGSSSQMNLLVPDSGGQGVVENVYLPGAHTSGHDYAGNPGIYVGRDHAGDILIRNVSVKRMQDNGIYASSPGHEGSDGAGGTVRVEGSYFDSNATSNIRMGTTGSYAENCVLKDCLHRGFWAYYEHPEIRNCEIFGSRRADILLGGSAHDKQNYAEATAENSAWETVEYGGDSTELHGESDGQMEDRVPTGCPTTPKEAASGTSSGGDSGGSDGGSEELPKSLTVETNEGGPLVEYEFVVDGAVEKGAGAEAGDTISATDGETTVTGKTGNGYADDFRFDGTLVDWTASVVPDSYTLLVDGAEIDPAQFGEGNTDEPAEPEPQSVTIETNEGGPLVEYEFVVDGTVEKGADAEAGDTLAAADGQTTVTGKTGNGYADDYTIVGELVDWTANVAADSYTLLVDGAEIDPAQFGEGDADEPAEPEPQPLVIETNEGGPLVEYEFVVDGTVEKGADAEGGDTISATDGQTTVTGKTGNGYTDDYTIAGELVDWTASVAADSYTVLVDGAEIDPAQFGEGDTDEPAEPEPQPLVIETNEGGPLVEYEFVVDGTVEKGADAEASDTLSAADGQTTVTGKTGNGYADDYTIVGELVDWTASVAADSYTVLVDGDEVNVS